MSSCWPGKSPNLIPVADKWPYRPEPQLRRLFPMVSVQTIFGHLRLETKSDNLRIQGLSPGPLLRASSLPF